MKKLLVITTLMLPLLLAPSCYPAQESGTNHPTLANCKAPNQTLLIQTVLREDPSNFGCQQFVGFPYYAYEHRWIPLDDTHCSWASEDALGVGFSAQLGITTPYVQTLVPGLGSWYCSQSVQRMTRYNTNCGYDIYACYQPTELP